jgi:hypothetical protein
MRCGHRRSKLARTSANAAAVLTPFARAADRMIALAGRALSLNPVAGRIEVQAADSAVVVDAMERLARNYRLGPR